MASPAPGADTRHDRALADPRARARAAARNGGNRLSVRRQLVALDGPEDHAANDSLRSRTPGALIRGDGRASAGPSVSASRCAVSASSTVPARDDKPVPSATTSTDPKDVLLVGIRAASSIAASRSSASKNRYPPIASLSSTNGPSAVSVLPS